MARLIVVTHEYDDFLHWRLLPWPRRCTRYVLFDVLRHFETFGHSWRIAKGPRALKGDVALLHVDCTIVDDSYLELASQYERTLNFGTGNISKAKISSLQVRPEDSWKGPVVVKSNFNHRGSMEEMHNSRAAQLARSLPHPGVRSVRQYELIERLQDVPGHVWSDPNLIVQRFVPEVDESGAYAYRTWVFMGRRERCTRNLASSWIAKAATTISYEPTDVPEHLRLERERLNFDYGKFDFVMHDGMPILLDANRTPGAAPQIIRLIKAVARNLAEGLHELVTGCPAT